MLTRLAIRSVRNARTGHKGISPYSKAAPPIQAANTGPVGGPFDSMSMVVGAVCFVWGMQIANTRGIFPPLI